MTQTPEKKPTISAGEMRDRLLAGLQRPSQFSGDWVVALGSEKNRELLGLIGRKNPTSIGELCDLTGRAQPNVSRSLSALSNAGLVVVEQKGRCSVPALTALGRQKAEELLLLEPMPNGADLDLASWLRVHFESAATVSDDLFDPSAVAGSLLLDLWFRGASQAAVAKFSGDILGPTAQLAKDWWNLLYRRDAPSRLLDVNIEGHEAKGILSLRSLGRHLQVMFRQTHGEGLRLDDRYMKLPIRQIEEDLLEHWVKPVARHQRSRSQMDSELQNTLASLLESRENELEAAFCRAAGALGVNPYGLSSEQARCIRKLMTEIQDEDARLDFASALLWDELKDGINWAETEVRAHAQRNSFPKLRELREASKTLTEERAMRPWRIGRDLATFVRKSLNMPNDRSVGGVIGLTHLLDVDTFDASRSAPGAVRGFQSTGEVGPIIVVEDEGPARTTFILARAIGDYLAFESHSACVANLYTDRQAVGRAFAAEFIAPSEGVAAMVEEGCPSYKIERHFGASPETVRWQYEHSGH